MIDTGKPDLDVLSHHGVKGMKWGVRKDAGHEGEQVAPKKIAKLDKKFEKKANLGTYIDIHNKAAAETNAHDVDRINNKPEYKNADFKRDSPLRQKYYKEQQDAYLKNVEKAVAEIGTNASGTRKLNMIELDGGDWTIEVGDVKHDALDDLYESLDGSVVKVTYDAQGHISRVDPDDTMEQSALEEDELAHYGVKGMKWGTRREPTAITVKTRPGKRVKTYGGKRQSASEDAIRVAGTRQKAKKSTTDSLSNKELQDLVARMNLEQQYARLSAGSTGKGKKIVEDLLDDLSKMPVGGK